MKKAFTSIILFFLVLSGCNASNEANYSSTESFSINSHPTVSREVTEATEPLDATSEDDQLVFSATEATTGKVFDIETADAEENPTDTSEVNNDPVVTQTNEEETQSQPPQTTETIPSQEEETVPTEPVQPDATEPVEPTETQPPTTEPEQTIPPSTEPASTEPPNTESTEPLVTEPPECQHDWMCIHLSEEGHWIAGIVCDCGWKVYGDPEEVVSLWNDHSASYPAAEALFDHGGYGCVDEWIVDVPAYDEWVCRHCAEPKP